MVERDHYFRSMFSRIRLCKVGAKIKIACRCEDFVFQAF
jgi:hypothetical protein